MRVLYDISHLGVGFVEQRARTGIYRVIENVAEQLVSHPECNVTFCSNLGPGQLTDAYDYWKNTPGISLAPFSQPPYFGRRRKVAERMNQLIHQFSSDTTLSALAKLQLRLQIKQLQVQTRFLNKYQHDLVHSSDLRSAQIYHSPFYALPQAISNKRFKGVFLTYYDLIPVLFPQYFPDDIRGIMHNILGSLTPETWVLCISANTRNDLLNHMGAKLNPDRVLVTELAASDNFYPSLNRDKNLQIRRKHKVPDNPYVLSLCTFEPRKNIDQVIKAFTRLVQQENIADLNLVLVGSKGWLFDEIFNELTRNEEVRKRIIITGFVADEDLAALYTDAMFFVYPSRYEGFGLPPLEAMKCGTPVITSNNSSLPEVVGEAGLMVAPTDLDALCESMLSLYRNPSMREQLSARSLLRADLFSWKECGNKTVEAYQKAILAS